MGLYTALDVDARIEALLLRPSGEPSIVSERVERAALTFEGIAGDHHASLTRPACVRTKSIYKRKTPIRNVRQVSIVSVEELAAIAERLEIPQVEPEWLGANVVISGIPALTMLPPSTRLSVADGASLVVDLENEPCRYPADVIEARFPGRGKRFVRAARHLRGLTGWVEREGELCVGARVLAHIPPQRVYTLGTQD
ncbi:MAG: MOSC domain-containing protein [Pseudomonadota bacterium]